MYCVFVASGVQFICFIRRAVYLFHTVYCVFVSSGVQFICFIRRAVYLFHRVYSLFVLYDVLFICFIGCKFICFIGRTVFVLENNIAVAWKRNLSKTTAFLEIYNRL